jgi:hypothetical protein
VVSGDSVCPINFTIRAKRLPGEYLSDDTNFSQNVPSKAGVASISARVTSLKVPALILAEMSSCLSP